MMYPKENEIKIMAKTTSRRINRVPRVINKDIALYLDDVESYSNAHEHIKKFV